MAPRLVLKGGVVLQAVVAIPLQITPAFLNLNPAVALCIATRLATYALRFTARSSLKASDMGSSRRIG